MEYKQHNVIGKILPLSVLFSFLSSKHLSWILVENWDGTMLVAKRDGHLPTHFRDKASRSVQRWFLKSFLPKKWWLQEHGPNFKFWKVNEGKGKSPYFRESFGDLNKQLEGKFPIHCFGFMLVNFNKNEIIFNL